MRLEFALLEDDKPFDDDDEWWYCNWFNNESEFKPSFVFYNITNKL